MFRHESRIGNGEYYCNKHEFKFKMEDSFYSAGYGCPECADEYNFSRSKNKHQCNLYLIELVHDDITLYKVGITSSGISKRYNKADRLKFINVQEWIYETKDKAIEEERRIINKNKELLYVGLSPFSDGTMTSEVFLSKPIF